MSAPTKPWNECKALIAGLRAAGSWKAFERAPRKTLIVLRCLHSKGPRDDGRPHHEVPLRAGGQRGRLERLSFWRARAPCTKYLDILLFSMPAC